ncbi:MAG: hypothetical protein OXU20_10705 [Myxococcales bacterium]|nr:hypothetical protein [Myxococcales bacterium]
MSRAWKIFLAAAAASGIAVAVFHLSSHQDPPLDPTTAPKGLPRRLATLLAPHPDLNPPPEGPVYVALRAQGIRVGEGWASGLTWRHAAINATEKVRAEHPDREAHIDAIELCVPHSYRNRAIRRRRGSLSNSHRGIDGLELTFHDKVSRYCPTSMIARNQSFPLVDTAFRREHGIKKDDFYSDASARSFGAHQFLVQLGNQDHIKPMYRGNTVVTMKAVTSKGVHRLARLMGDWMVQQLQDNGRMIYRYFPSSGRESTGNNMIRQYMASLCLVRLAQWRKDSDLMARAEHNLRYNFSRFFRRDGDIGLITFRGRSKLGAAALAALGVVEAPFRDKLQEFETPLVRMTEQMLQPEGRFITFYGTTSHDNANFYAGETLLLWATMYQKQQDPALLERFMRAFRYYKEWHLDNRNPAFIPWHVQAYYRMWQVTKDPALSDFVFVMSDWLLDMQEWDESPYLDTLGRFYDDNRRQYGVPHASSTGVYLEGYIDAYRLAKELGDEGRMVNYRLAILRGLRSLMQLQFEDDIDMFYVSRQDRVLGGIRTTVYDNSIRVDNVQHGLMAIMRIIDEFDAHDLW